ncbi:MAG: hypothetical protein IIZ34_05295, partial [Eubacterium sp.]|nr:hypothetical protein [Eubacterium sp.]
AVYAVAAAGMVCVARRRGFSEQYYSLAGMGCQTRYIGYNPTDWLVQPPLDIPSTRFRAHTALPFSVR